MFDLDKLRKEIHETIDSKNELALAKVRGQLQWLSLTDKAHQNSEITWILKAQEGTLEKFQYVYSASKLEGDTELVALARNLFENIIWLKLFNKDHGYGLVFYYQLLSEQLKSQEQVIEKARGEIALFEELAEEDKIDLGPYSHLMSKADASETEIKKAREYLSNRSAAVDSKARNSFSIYAAYAKHNGYSYQAYLIKMTAGMLELLKACVKARLNILICGGTGSGKTTLLNALSSYIPEDERIVTIEDAAELRLQQTHVARMETRPPNVEGVGAIHIRQLVINALRMRPDRIIVGEVRAEEALDMLQAMNTGHDGSLTTIHANTPRDGLGRLEVMVGMANSNMGVRSIRQQIASAVDLFIQISRFSDGTRRVTHITEVVGMEQDTITLQDIFLFEKTGITEDGQGLGTFPRHGHSSQVLRALAGVRNYVAGSDLSERGGDQLMAAGGRFFCRGLRPRPAGGQRGDEVLRGQAKEAGRRHAEYRLGATADGIATC